jgi:hypothetical protein
VGPRVGLGEIWRRETHLFLPGFETRTAFFATGSYTDDTILAITRTTIRLLTQLVKALRYMSEGRGFDSQWCHWNFSLT